jgi:hypothetical protein
VLCDWIVLDGRKVSIDDAGRLNSVPIVRAYLTLLAILAACCGGTFAVSADSLPKIPAVLFGVNQYNVGPPQQLARGWPLTDEDAAYLKSLGCNAIRFPLYPSEVGLDEGKLLTWPDDGSFDPSSLGKPDWRSLDTVMDWMIRHQFTPNVCPSPEVREDWTTKAWMSLHVPENAERSVWFTLLVVDHLTAKYGDQVIYGWYENWWWNSYKHEKSSRFPAAFRQKLAEMYDDKIKALNKSWNTAYKSFAEVDVPRLMASTGSGVDPAAINSRRTYDLRKAMDLIQRDVLRDLRADIKRAAPGAKWAGGCLLNSVGALADIRSATVPSCAASMRTAAETGDFISADLYSDSLEYYSHYRTLSKFAAVSGNKLFIAEVPAVKPRAFKLVADVGGPSAGAMAWCGREDVWGLIKGDGTRRIENGLAWRTLHQTYAENPKRFSSYKPGTIHFYFPEETLNYSITDQNFIDAFNHVCDFMNPEELELVLTDELDRLPRNARIFVLERTLPERAIKRLGKMGNRVFSPHAFFLDENGRKHASKNTDRDFFAELQALPEGGKLLDVFRRVEEKTDNVAFWFDGAEITSPAKLAPHNDVIPGRPNQFSNLIDGSYTDGITFADVEQTESVTIKLKAHRSIRGAFIDYFEGDGQQVPASRIPQQVLLSASLDGKAYAPVATMSNTVAGGRSRVRFAPVNASHIRFDFEQSTSNRGLRLVEIGVVGTTSE